jgi:hypothetical protein
MTPSIAIVRVETPDFRMIPLWVPLFLLWIPALLLSPLILLVIFGLSLAGRINPFTACRVLWGLVCALRGIQVRVHAEDANVYVRIL